MNPAVTVVIPCHNHDKWVQAAISSVIDQKYDNKRIVVVDDGSSDQSSEMITNLMTDKKLVVTENPTVYVGLIRSVQTMAVRFTTARGPSFARNYGIKVGWDNTDAFMFLDSDDMYMPGKMEKSVKKWQEAPLHIGAVYTDFDNYFPASGLRIRQYKEPFSRMRLVQECLPNMDSLVSKFAFETCGLFDEEMRTCEDYDLWMRLAEKFMIIHIPEPLLTLRIGDHSSSNQVPSEIWKRNWQRVMEKAKARMNNA
jgi:glycosyltransferase involved in cell wall biosynthesis